MKNILENLEKKFKNSKGIIIYTSDNLRIHVRYDVNALIHALGIKRIYKYKSLPIKVLLTQIRKEKITIDSIKKSNVNKKEIKYILYKYETINFFMNLEEDNIKNIKLFRNIKFKKYNSDYIIFKDGYMICLGSCIRKEKDDNFDSVFIISIRKINIKDSKGFLFNKNESYIKNISFVQK